MVKIGILRLFIFFGIIGVMPLAAFCQSSDITEIKSDVNDLLSAAIRDKGLNESRLKPEIDRIVKRGEAAVPLLVEAYVQNKTDEGNRGNRYRRIIVYTLCQIPSRESLDFLEDLMQKHENEDATATAINNFPVEKEEEITPILINLLKREDTVHYRMNIDERLRKMVFRRPKVAGELVEALQDSPDAVDENYKITDVLRYISATSIGTSSPPGAEPIAYRNESWRKWWEKNKNKDALGWLVEAYNSGNKEKALQVMGSLHDKRAIPYFKESLGSTVWAAEGLRRLETGE